MKTIIGFDSWTQGSYHFERLVKAMEIQQYKLILIHVGSWGHDRDRPSEEMIGQLLVRDISYYKGLSLSEILEKEKPSGVLFLSMQAYAHRAFNRYCKYLKIPTMHLYHGLVSVQATSLKKMISVNWYSQLLLFSSRIFDNVRKILPIYLKSLVETRSSWNEWMWFLKDIWRKISGTSYSENAAPDTSTDLCCVYAEVDVHHAIQRYRMSPDKVKIVGNPDLTFFNLKENIINSYKFCEKLSDKYIIYIDTAFTAAGAVYDNQTDFIDHLNKTAIALQQKGYKLVVKLHPAHDNHIQEQLKKFDIEVCEREKFVQCLLGASAAIVEPSSAALIPALIGLPIFLAQYGKLCQQQYGQVLTSYPRVSKLNDICIVGGEIENIKKMNNKKECNEWIEQNIGPMPSEDMPKRVIEFFQKIMEKR